MEFGVQLLFRHEGGKEGTGLLFRKLQGLHGFLRGPGGVSKVACRRVGAALEIGQGQHFPPLRSSVRNFHVVFHLPCRSVKDSTALALSSSSTCRNNFVSRS